MKLEIAGVVIAGAFVYAGLRLLGGTESDEAASTTHLTSGTAPNDEADRIRKLQNSVQSFWTGALSKEGTQYRPADIVLVTDATASSCGVATALTGSFYCPEDEKVYLDSGFFDDLRSRFHTKGGDLAEAYVVAHEYGHHVQSILGTERAFEAAVVRDPEQRIPLSVMMELQADCLAGVWAHSTYDRSKLSEEEISHALVAASTVGDDRVEQPLGGHMRPENFVHGSAESRNHWFQTGLSTGDLGACDTFKGRL